MCLSMCRLPLYCFLLISCVRIATFLTIASAFHLFVFSLRHFVNSIISLCLALLYSSFCISACVSIFSLWLNLPTVGTCDQCDQIERFLKFLVANYLQKVAQMYGDFLSFSEKHPFQGITVVATFWAAFGNIWATFFQHLVTLQLRCQMTKSFEAHCDGIVNLKQLLLSE